MLPVVSRALLEVYRFLLSLKIGLCEKDMHKSDTLKHISQKWKLFKKTLNDK